MIGGAISRVVPAESEKKSRRHRRIRSAAGGVGMTLFAAAGFYATAFVERPPGWLRTLFILLGLVGVPFWWAAGLFGSWAGGPRAWTIAAALLANAAVWAALFHAGGALLRLVRTRRIGTPGKPDS